MSTPEEKCTVARRLLLELEARDQQTIALFKKALGEIEEDVRELRRESAKRDMQIYTEAEFAALFKVSESTMARERKAGHIHPLEMGQHVVRYSSLQLEQAHAIFGSKLRLVKKKKEQRAS
jgi:hypothetical protein